jgi:hypothetical protein
MKKGFCLMALGFLLLGTSVFSQVNADWSIPLQITLDGSPLTPLPLELGMKQGATDQFDNGMDAIAPLATPEGDDAYFLSAVGEMSPYDKLLKDFRPVSGALSTWKLILTIAPGKTIAVDWSSISLPKEKIASWQEADAHWSGQGLIHYFTDNPRQLIYKNTTEDVLIKRILIKAN